VPGLESAAVSSNTQADGLRAGVVGLGAIGGGVAVCLARKGRPLAVYDVRGDATASLEGVPAALVSPAAVARHSDVVMIAVVNARQVRDVLEGPRGLLAGAHPGLAIVLLSTVSLQELGELLARARSDGVAMLDCGVTGGPESAPRGQLIAMLGGEEALVRRVRPVIEDWAELVLHMGPTGAGMAAKIARNVVHFQVWQAGHEGALLASRAGVDLAKFAALVERAASKPGASATVWMTEESLNPPEPWPEDELRLRRHVLALLRKDLEAALSLAASLGLRLPATEVAYCSGADVLGLREGATCRT
jgi:3-hydroxyisobutyrate dehydrogenase-like beta-hydroxyacid dehydrogenase